MTRFPVSHIALRDSVFKGRSKSTKNKYSCELYISDDVCSIDVINTRSNSFLTEFNKVLPDQFFLMLDFLLGTVISKPSPHSI